MKEGFTPGLESSQLLSGLTDGRRRHTAGLRADAGRGCTDRSVNRVSFQDVAWFSRCGKGRAGKALASTTHLQDGDDGGFVPARRLVPLTPVVGLVLLEPSGDFFDSIETVNDVIGGIWIA